MSLAAAVPESDAGVRSVARAVTILFDVRAHPTDGVTAIAKRLDMHKSTVSRLLAQMVASGLVTDEGGVYGLSSALAVAPVMWRDGPTVIVGGKAVTPRQSRRAPVIQWRAPSPDWTPLCMDADELAHWQNSNDCMPDYGGLHAATPCTDCTLGYAAEMRAIGKCNGVPGGAEEDDEPEPTPRQESRHMSTTVHTLVTAPCGTCLHAAVCSRRASIAELDSAIVEVETLAEGLSVALSAVIECDAYLKAPKVRTASVTASEKPKPSGGEWTAERRARMAESMRQRHLARGLTGNVSGEPIRQLETVETAV